MRLPFIHKENTPTGGGLGSVALPSPVPKGEGPGAPSAWFGNLTGTGVTRQVAQISIYRDDGQSDPCRPPSTELQAGTAPQAVKCGHASLSLTNLDAWTQYGRSTQPLARHRDAGRRLRQAQI